MEKSLFAGLTILDPNDSLFEDGGAFTGRDRRIIDRYLQLGAKTHRHLGLSGLDNPDLAMGASGVASGGQMPAGVSISVGYTLEDDTGGETLLSPLITVATPSPIDTPTMAPALTMNYGAGGLLADTYYYAYSYVDGQGGETPVGPVASVEREPGYPNGRTLINGLLGSGAMALASAAGWNLYRAVGGGDLHFLATGSDDSFIDDGSQSVNCDITPLPTTTNTTNGDNSLAFELPPLSNAKVAAANFINVYASFDGTFLGDCLVDQFPLASAGQTVSYGILNLLSERPPDVNTSIGTPGKIDPDVEILDWHWKRPVATEGDLPLDAEEGDVRVTLDTGMLWEFHDGAWGRSGGQVRIFLDGATMMSPTLSDDFTDSLDFTTHWSQEATGASPYTLDTGPPGRVVAGENYPPTIILRDAPVIDLTDGSSVDVVTKIHIGSGTQLEYNIGLNMPDYSAGKLGWIRVYDNNDALVYIGADPSESASDTLANLGLSRGETYWCRVRYNVDGVYGACDLALFDSDPTSGSPTPIVSVATASTPSDFDQYTGVVPMVYMTRIPGTTDVWVESFGVYQEVPDPNGSLPADVLKFTGSGGIDVGILDQGGGLVEIVVDGSRILASAGSGGSGGSGGGSIEEVLDGLSGSVSNPSRIKFLGSGVASATVNDAGGGLAEVTFTVPPGAQGPPGASGAPGEPGASGAPGAPGADGADGRTVLSDAGAPDPGDGEDGDFYIDTAAWEIYGPKTSGSWGAATSLVGPQGPAGSGGSGGGSIDEIFDDTLGSVLNPSRIQFLGSGAASASVLDAGSGLAQVTIAGMPGPQGPQGVQGPSGDQGPQGASGEQGPEGPSGAQGPMGPHGSAILHGLEAPGSADGNAGDWWIDADTWVLYGPKLGSGTWEGRVNSALDPSFEYGIDGWISNHGESDSVARVEGHAWDGTHSLEVDCQGLNSFEGALSNEIIMPDDWDPADGISISVRAEGDGAPENITWQIQECDIGGNWLRNQSVGNTVIQSGSHSLFEFAFLPIHPDCHGIRIQVWHGTTHEGKFWLDAVQVEGGMTPGTFFSGDTPGCTWDGTPGNSPSHIGGQTSLIGPQGPQGPQGSAGLPGPPGGTIEGLVLEASGVSVGDLFHVEFVGSGGAEVSLDDLGGGSARLTVLAGGGGGEVGLPAREVLSASATLGWGASAAIDLPAYAGQRLLSVDASIASCLRVYATEAARDADAGRPIGAQQDAQAYAHLDFVAPGSGSYPLNPVVDVHNLDSPPENVLYLAIWNNTFAGSADVALDIMVQKTEEV